MQASTRRPALAVAAARSLHLHEAARSVLLDVQQLKSRVWTGRLGLLVSGQFGSLYRRSADPLELPDRDVAALDAVHRRLSCC